MKRFSPGWFPEKRLIFFALMKKAKNVTWEYNKTHSFRENGVWLRQKLKQSNKLKNSLFAI